MTSAHGQPERSNLDAYLDGTLPAEQREAMERQIEASPELQAEIALQRQIDQSLLRSFAPAVVPADLADKLRAAPSTLHPATSNPRRRRLLMVGAALAASIGWGIVAFQFFYASAPTSRYNPNQPLATIYKTRVEQGFRPTWVCDDQHQFASTFLERQGQGLLLADMPTGSKMVGLTYCGGLSRYTTTMLAHVDGKPVMVFVDRTSADTHPPKPPPESNLHLFRKELGPLVMYELTPLDRPSVMDYLYMAEVPPPTTTR